MRTRRLLLSLVVLVCSSLSLSCSSNAGGDAAPPQGETPPLPQGPGPSLSAPPGTTVSAGGRSVDMGTGTYCWTRMCVDKIGPITRARLDVQRGTRLVVAIPAGPPPLREASVSAFPAGASQAVGNGETAWQPDFDRATELPPSWQRRAQAQTSRSRRTCRRAVTCWSWACSSTPATCSTPSSWTCAECFT